MHLSIVVLAMPAVLSGLPYTATAETFAAVAECALFAELFRRRWVWRDMAAITAANVASFLTGLWLFG